jgi:DNA-binding CsgD family transcriptional regulator
MSKKMHKFKGEISNQLSLQRTGNGFQLIESENRGISLKSANNLPFNFYLTTHDNIMRFMNELDAMTLGYTSAKAAVGKNIHERISPKAARTIIRNNDYVIKTNKMLIAEEAAQGQGYSSRCLSIKYPLYVENKTIGIMGCSVHFDRDCLATSLNQIINTGLLNIGQADHIQKVFNSCPYNFSKREKECLYYSIKGKSAREIASLLNLSRRTVEQYLMHIKIKMKVSTRSQMIELGLDLFMDSNTLL